MADEKPLSVPVEAFDAEMLAASLAELQAELIGGFTDAGAAAAKAFADGFKGSTKSLDKVAKDIERIQKSQAKLSKEGAQEAKKQTDAEKAAAKAVKEHADALAFVEKAWHRALKPSEKTAELLAKVKDLRFDDVKGISAQAVAIARLTEKMEDQQRREKANRGRSLSMLFDEQNELLKMLPGRFGEYAEAIDAARGAASRAAESFQRMRDAGEAGNIALGASIGLLGAIVTGGAAAAATVYSLSDAFYENVNAINRVAQGSAISAEQLSRYQVAAQRYGFELDEFADIHGNIAEKMQRAIVEGGNERDLFKALGVEVQKTDGTLRDVGDVFLELTDYLSTTTDKTSALAVAQEFLGEDSAKKLLPAIQAEALGFRKAAEEADALGLSLSGENLAAAKAHKRAADDLTNSWEAFKKRIAENSSISRFFDDLKIAAADTLAQDGIVAGVKELESGNRITIKVFRMFGESVTEFGDRVRQTRKEIDEHNAALRKTKEDLKGEGEQAETLEQILIRLRKEREKHTQKRGPTIDVVADESIRRQAERDAETYMETLAIATRDAAAAGLTAPEIAVDFESFEAEITKSVEENAKERMDADVRAAKMAIQLEEQRREAIFTTLGITSEAFRVAGDLVLEFGKDQRKATLQAFRLHKAAAISQILIDSFRTFASVYADIPGGPVVRGLVAGAASATVAAQAIPVARQQPPQVTHAGGVIVRGPQPQGGLPLEVMNRAEVGEGRVSRADMDSIGGGAGLNSILLERARGGGSRVRELPVQVMGQRALGRGVRQSYMAHGSLRQLLQGNRVAGMNQEI